MVNKIVSAMFHNGPFVFKIDTVIDSTSRFIITFVVLCVKDIYVQIRQLSESNRIVELNKMIDINILI